MEKVIIKGRDGNIKNIEVRSIGGVMSENLQIFRAPAFVSIAQVEDMPDKPVVLTISIEDMTVLAEFNSDFPLLFEEGIKLWK